MAEAESGPNPWPRISCSEPVSSVTFSVSCRSLQSHGLAGHGRKCKAVPINSYHMKEHGKIIKTFSLYLYPMNFSKIGCILVFHNYLMTFIYMFLSLGFFFGSFFFPYWQKNRCLHFLIKNVQFLYHTHKTTKSASLLKTLFPTPVNFPFPFGPIAFCHRFVILRLYLFPSGFNFHFSLDFLDFFSIFLGFLFHLTQIYSQFYCCFAENIFFRNISVLYVCCLSV